MAVSMEGRGVPAVDSSAQLLLEMLRQAELVKQTNTVEPPLSKNDLGDLWAQFDSIFSDATTLETKKRGQYAIIETAARDTFNNLLASTSIETPAFVKLWNLLDIISILSDDEQCEPALLFWLVEELLDSQTIAGCRKIFDYLESRREKITAKHFAQKNLVILRSCNELLRRLSRAEDTAFCGRVFIFMFQSFPLGDKSSVNLRGEYHVENVTSFDALPPNVGDPEKMDVDSVSSSNATPANGRLSTPKPSDDSSSAKGTASSKREPPMKPDELYPIFWSLQQSFSQPKKLFDATHFAEFKKGLGATVTMFRSVQHENSGRSAGKLVDDTKKGTKRKRGQADDDLANSFNPKYLTSRDLFELEISDLSFRRHILVQILIIMDFLLSLSSKAKEKLAKALPDNPNKSVMYADQTLSEEDTKWALDMKKSIADYLKQGSDGAFFYRMIETVLSRDKNWVRWKIENCPSIGRPSVSPDDFVAAKASARKVTMNKRLRPNPLGSLDLKFLAENDVQAGLERLKKPERYHVPSVKSFKSKIELDDMDIEMARDEESKNAAIEAKSSKCWRALRIASATKLVAFDKIERSDNIEEIFKDDVKPEEAVTAADEELDGEEPTFPDDRRPIVITGPSGSGKGSLIKKLTENHKKVFTAKVTHTTRPQKDDEVNGQEYFFVGKDEYDSMRDEGDFLEYGHFNGHEYGTSRKLVEGIIGQDKIPVMEMDANGIQQLKDKGFASRFIRLVPPHISDLQMRLETKGIDTGEEIQAKMEAAKIDLDSETVEGFYDKIFINDDFEATYEGLEKYIFGKEEEESQNNEEQSAQTDVEMSQGGTGEEPQQTEEPAQATSIAVSTTES
ncbi:guanylate kinase protein [Rutstroemia sp. NJR-2017a WRK4]|nr:guanylate kinase protein [Rutstroemia sp. NJR-2017a WRK4]